jgi:hypothetical protein
MSPDPETSASCLRSARNMRFAPPSEHRGEKAVSLQIYDYVYIWGGEEGGGGGGGGGIYMLIGRITYI